MKRSRSLFQFSVVAGAVATLVSAFATPVNAHPEGAPHHNPLPVHATDVMRAFAQDQQPATAGAALGPTSCVDNFAGPYPCSNVDLLSYLPLSAIGGTRSNSAANDIWGWTDASGGEYAIIGRVFGTSFVNISDPTAPVYLGELPTHGAFGSSWRDIKVYQDHAYIVSEAQSHGMQVFDLTRLIGHTGPPVTFTETAHYNKVASAHNIAINEDSGFAYIVGASGKNSCSGGLHMVDISAPASPSFAGCFSADGYTHDTQCVNYDGPDTARHGQEICFNSNEDTLTIVDVSVKSAPVQLARVAYSGSAYTHQGWLTQDKRYFLLDDELDEQNFGHGTLTRVFDVSSLTNPRVVREYESQATAIDHNQYVKDWLSFQANYRAGLRILDVGKAINGPGDNEAPIGYAELGYFDIYPADDAAEFNGAWSTYPYFASGNVVVSGIEQGLFVLRPSVGSGTAPSPPPSLPTMHVADLDGSATAGKARRWNASVTVVVHDVNDAVVAGATVNGTWSGGASGTGSCTTDALGTCAIAKTNISRNSTSATFTVESVTAATHSYSAAANHDDDGDSDGTSITVTKP